MNPDELYMKIALDMARKGKGRVEPNPMVGALVVHDGEIVGRGFHRGFGLPHAEVEALEQAGGRARGADLYVTLEPCCHQGKTPPCADAIVAAGIARVVAAMEDPDGRCCGAGFARLADEGVACVSGILEQEARILNAPYIKLRSRGIPHVIAKWAMTLDGRIAPAPGRRAVISTRKSRELVHRIRGEVDGIVVGVGTVLADDPQLTCRLKGYDSPLRIILDSRARTPLDSNVVRSAREVPTLVAVTEGAAPGRIAGLRDAGVDVLPVAPENGRVDLNRLLRNLGEREMTNLLIEGGAEVLASAFASGEVDRVMAFIAPRIFGGRSAVPPLGGRSLLALGGPLELDGMRMREIDGDVLIEGFVRRPSPS
jgi:diaminohydroxyphosphoribosylaminopyrimidine deaminase/5-amino-6-(5-phosphoribosylamino)uracil reductase